MRAVAVGLALVALLLLSVAAAPASASCPNEAFRDGLSANLPDCRAYELVTPPNGEFHFPASDIAGGSNGFITSPVTSDGSNFLFGGGGGSFAGYEGAGSGDQYAASRGSDGWTTELVGPSGAQSDQPLVGGTTPDHAYAFWQLSGKGSLVLEGQQTSYVRLPNGQFQILGVGSLGVDPTSQGRLISPGANHIIFSANVQLEPDAPETGTEALYDRPLDGPTRVVSLLPGDVTPPSGPNAVFQGVSADGTVVSFTFGNPGSEPLYARINNTKTVMVAPAGSISAGISNDGSRIYSVQSGDIWEFDVASETSRQITNSGDVTVVTISDDDSHIYFTSPSQLDGAKGVAGQPNLYVWRRADDSVTFIGTLDPQDVASEQVDLGNWANYSGRTRRAGTFWGPGNNAYDVTPDGSVFVFESRAQLTSAETAGYQQIYRYDTRDQSLVCVSCNPSGAASTADSMLHGKDAEGTSLSSAIYEIHNVSDNGRRVFFETTQPLVPRDGTEGNDIYEWQSDNGSSSVQLITSGQGPRSYEAPISAWVPNDIWAITPDGSDVFFFTREALTPEIAAQNAGAIYDARVGGGYPLTQAGGDRCQGDACQGNPSSPLVEEVAGSEGTFPGNRLFAVSHRTRCKSLARRAAKAKSRAKHLRHRARNSNSKRRTHMLRKRARQQARQARHLTRRANRCKGGSR